MDEHEARLAALHKTRTSMPETVAAMIRKATGRAPEKLERIVVGETNEVYAVRVDGGAEVVLRIDHLGRDFAAEVWATERARKAGVPAAAVVAHGCLDNDEEGPTNYLVLERLPGRSLGALREHETPPGQDRMRRMIEDAGALLARLHSVETAGYGHLDSLGRGAAPTLEGWWFLDAGGYGPSLVKNGLEELVDVVAQRLLDVRTQFAGPRCLVHGDFGPKHVFVDEDDRIVGIIDFGNVQSGDATFDLAPWGFWWDKHIPLEWLIAGYTRATELGDRFEERMRLARLIHLVGTTVYFTEQAPFPYWATESAKAIRELVGQR